MSPVVLALERSYRACAACAPETPAEHDFATQVRPSFSSPHPHPLLSPLVPSLPTTLTPALVPISPPFLLSSLSSRPWSRLHDLEQRKQAWVSGTPAHANAPQVLPQLAAAIALFKSPSAEAIGQLGTQPQACWAPLKSLLQQLDEQLRRPAIKTRHVSPALASLVDSAVPMPGLHASSAFASASAHHHHHHHGGGAALGPPADAGDGGGGGGRGGGGGGGVTIAGVRPVLRALFTKTRPKRLVLLGSDGHDYVFLLKGRDDLRMDERLMQVRGAALLFG